ncbi:hypothetical protein BVC80_8801g23 [Macleaya cordata]|uniref:Transmembrane protein n=1 Tax=Macleaya cordata TaxID=56857 RepID=A0A200QE97_MACCD|nr:hypothetical protein BVC80_8801g23 [Macleaya cordata]
MSFKQAITFLFILIIGVAILSRSGVEATRVLSEDFASANHLVTYPNTVYEKAKSTMTCWLGRLASGPSPKGPGN